MANIVKHRFSSAKADGGDATQVQPSHWNDGHTLTGGAAGDVLTRDPTDASFGAAWSKVGQWVEVPFNAANFSATGTMQFLVSPANVIVNRYTVIGKTMIWVVVIQQASIGGTPSHALAIVLPAGLSCSLNHGIMPTGQLQDTGWVNGVVISDVNGVHIQKYPFGSFNLNTGTTYVQFTVILELD